MEPVGHGHESIRAMHANAKSALAVQSFEGVTVLGLSAGGGRPSSEDGNYHGVTATAAFFYLYRSEEHTSELQSLMRISYAVFCLKKKNTHTRNERKQSQL